MTNESTILQLIANISVLLSGKIHENDAAKFKAEFEKIKVTSIDSGEDVSLTQSFPIEFNSFLATVLENLFNKVINFSFIEKEVNKLGLLIHYSDLRNGKFVEDIDSLYKIDQSKLILETKAGEYTKLTDNFRNNLGPQIKQQTSGLLTEVVSFKMKNVINYLLLSFAELQKVAHFKRVDNIEFEMLQYTDDTITDYQDTYTVNKGRISIGARLSFSYLQDGTLAIGKLPLYNIGTLHP